MTAYYDELLARASNLERYPFESATMAEAGKLAAKHLRDAARDLGNGESSFRSAALVICEGDDTDAVKVRRIWRLAAQESALPHMHTKPPEPRHECETCTASHEIFYIQLSDDGTAIRKWQRSPFEGGRMFRAALNLALAAAASGENSRSEVEGEAPQSGPNASEGNAQ